MNNDKGIIAWMVKNHVAANLLMIALLIGGLIVLSDIKQEIFPEYTLNIVNVSVSYPGASPEEVEEGIILSVENKIRSLENIKRITSTANEGRAKISIELLRGTDPNKSLQDIKNAIDRIISMPEESERPRINLSTRRRVLMSLALYGDLDERTLYYYAQNIRDEILSLHSVTHIELRGVRHPEISVEVPQAMLRSYGLTLKDISQTIHSSAVDVPAGGIKTGGGEVLLRTSERRDFAGEFEGITLVSKRDGTELKLSDIARITDGFAESNREAYFNGQRAILFYVYRTGEQTPLEISKDVRQYINAKQGSLPEDTKIIIYNDRSDIYKARMDMLLKNGTIGLALVMLTLGLFLEVRLAFWIAMGIPISIIGSFIFLPMFNSSINMVSLFAFIITLGIIVDDAVVVGENIYHKRQEGVLPTEASIGGVREIAIMVTIAVMTNIIAFLPLLFVPGSTGKFFAVLPTVVISVFLISLIECIFILPAHLAYRRMDNEGRILNIIGEVPSLCAKGMKWFIDRCFTTMLHFSLSNRYLIVSLSLGVLIIVYAFWDSGRIHFSFRPQIQSDWIQAEVTLPFGSPLEDVRHVARLIEEGGLRGVDNSGEKEILIGVMTDVGRRGSNTAEVTFRLIPQSERNITAHEFSNYWRKEVGEIAGLESLFFDYMVGPGGSAAINIELTHPDPETLEMAASDLADTLTNYKGVTDIDDGFARGKPQYDFKIRPEGLSMGLDARELGRQVRHAFYGAESIRQQRGRDEVKVMVRLPESERKSLYNLEELLIRTPDGGEIPLDQASKFKIGRAYTEINRVDGKRVLNVTANVLPGIANENKILTSIKSDYLPDLLAKYIGLRYSFEGRQREQREALNNLLKSLSFALLGIFCLLAILFRSYTQAIIVMLSIPFGIASSLAGHVIMGFELSIISIFGMIALCGVVINGGLVLTATANRLRDSGEKPFQAVLNAGIRRFRPIFLTAITTFFGLAPMIFETSIQARFLIPMAISLGYGILFSTVVILLFIPALYVIHQDVKSYLHKSLLSINNHVFKKDITKHESCNSERM